MKLIKICTKNRDKKYFSTTPVKINIVILSMY